MLPYSNLQLKHQNPGAEKPLILPIQVICNTSDEQIFSNIYTNSRRPGFWLTSSPAHEGHAILCGSGPSIADYIEDIRKAQSAGGAVFALNNAANFLKSHGIKADYQVIIDARPETAQLVGPADVHLFASQVHPACFEKAPKAKVWHLQVENIDDHLPDYEFPHVLIGGAASVGNTAVCLAYSMGYRALDLYGYDSSSKAGVTHVVHQKINDGEPMAWVKFLGRDYHVSLTMKLQAEKFMQTSRDLRQLGCKIKVHGTGLLPDMFNAPTKQLSEREKYELMWTYDVYRDVSPGEEAVDEFIKNVPTGTRVLDLGCGTGRAGIKLAKLGYQVTLVDFTENSRDYEALPLPFVCADLSSAELPKADAALCADVMEHIPTEQVRIVLQNICKTAPVVFFQISTVPDNLGAEIGQDLHLTVRPHSWWLNELLRLGDVAWQRQDRVASLFLVYTH